MRPTADYLERLIEVAEAAIGLVEESECWVTHERVGCGTCYWCALANAVDALREAQDT